MPPHFLRLYISYKEKMMPYIDHFDSRDRETTLKFYRFVNPIACIVICYQCLLQGVDYNFWEEGGHVSMEMGT